MNNKNWLSVFVLLVLIGFVSASYDPNAGLWGYDNGNISYMNGNVGIGTSSPTEALEVSGNFKSNGRFLASDGLYNSPSYSFSSVNNVGMTLLDVDTLLLTYPFAGDLQVVNSDGTTGLWITDTNSRFKDGNAASPGIGFINEAGFDTGIFRVSSEVLGFSTGAIERMRIDDVGNVGIGTTSPLGRFNVNGSTDYILMNFTDGRVSSNTSRIARFSTSSSNFNILLDDNDTTYLHSGDSGSGEVAISTRTLGVNYERMRITNDGFVGIGTSSPSQALHVEGNVNVTGDLYVNYSSIYLGTGKISFDESSNSFSFYNESGTSEISTVSVGATSPPGAIIMYGGSTAPVGWILANGSAISRTTYADLFSVIGTTFGVGDGSTTFNVPDMTNKFARGSTLGSTGGNDNAIVVSHGHTFTGNALETHGHADNFAFSGNALGTHSHTTVMGSHNHRSGALLDTRGTNLYGAYAAGTKSGYYFFASSSAATESPYTSSTNLGTKGSNSVSAGTPTGTITGDVTSASAGTPSGTISTVGSSGTNANIPAYLGLNYIIKY